MKKTETRVHWCASLLMMLVTGQLFAAELLKDINIVPIPASSSPRYLGAAGQYAMFVGGAGSAAVDLGLWASDGTPTGTRRVLDGNAANAFFNPRSLTSIGSRALWIGTGTSNAQTLWVSDGSTAGTLKLAEFNVLKFGMVGKLPNGAAVFGVLTDQSSIELWRTDGTVAGTWRLGQFNSTPDEALPEGAVVGNNLYFSATTELGKELWVTDGSSIPGNTHLEIDLAPGPESSEPFQITAIGSNLYFTAVLDSTGIAQLWRRNASGNFQALTNPSMGASILCASDNILYFQSMGQPWRSDGTVGGTFSLVTPQQGSFESVGYCVVAGNKVFFQLDMTDTDPQLWQSSGTVNSTTVVSTGVNPFNPTPLLWSGTHLFFSGYDDVHGVELWVTNGTLVGTHLVMDAFPGSVGGSASPIAVVGSQVILKASRFSYNYPDDLLSEIWRVSLDGTGALRLTSNVSLVAYGTEDSHVLVANNRFFFTSQDSVQGIEPSVTDGTLAGTGILRDIAAQTQNIDSNPAGFVTVGNNALFWADDGIQGRELWISDGSAAGTKLLTDVFAGARGSNGLFKGVFQDVAYFYAEDATHGSELWRTDGTATGTRLVADIEAGIGGSYDFNCLKTLKLGSFVYFAAHTTTNGTELWRSDGTVGGTQLVADIAPGVANSNACPLVVVGSALYFSATDSRGLEVWVTDGTTAGTHIIADLVPGAAGVSPRFAVAYQNDVVFAAGNAGGTSGGARQLWTTNSGTPRLLIDLPQPLGGGLVWINTMNDAIYFGVSGGTAQGIYKWAGGTDVPLRVVTTTQPLFGNAYVIDTRIVFLGHTPSEGTELFITDGTEAGTNPITSYSAAGETNVSSPALLQGKTVYFRVGSADHSAQLARTNGTASGTQLLTSFVGGSDGFVSGPIVAGGQVVFAAKDSALGIGQELFVQSNQVPQAVADSAVAAGTQPINIPLIANDMDVDGSVMATSVRIVVLPSNGTVTVDPSGIATYRANASFVGTDTFQYTVVDNAGVQSNAAVVTVTVNAPPVQPVAGDGGGSGAGSGGGGGSFQVLMILILGSMFAMRVMASRTQSRECEKRRRLS